MSTAQNTAASHSSTAAIQRYANALYGVQVGMQTMAQVQREVADAQGSLSAVFNTYFERSFGSLSTTQVALRLVDALGIAPTGATIAKNYIVAQLANAAPGERGAVLAQILELYSSLTSDAVFGASAAAWNAEVEAALAYAGQGDIAVGVGRSFQADPNLQEPVGTVFDDNFSATLDKSNSNFIFDGRAGQDVLAAVTPSDHSVNNLNEMLGLISRGIETVQVQSKYLSPSPSSNIARDEVGTRITAQRTDGVRQWESKGSDADLVIEDVRIRDDQATQDITLAMRNTAAGNVDFEVYFQRDSLRNNIVTPSLIKLEVMDVGAAANGLATLRDSPYGGFVLTVTDTITGMSEVKTIASQAIQDAQTYSELAIAFQHAFDAALGINKVRVTAGDDFTVFDQRTQQSVIGQQINLTAVAPIALSTSLDSGWLATGLTVAENLYTNFYSADLNSMAPITSRVILDNVGLGGVGGDLLVGQLPDGDAAPVKGIEKFILEVQGSSKLQTIRSTGNALSEVVLYNTGSAGIAPNAQEYGNLSVNGTPASSANTAAVDGFSDVRVIDGSGMRGDIKYTAELTQASVAKYLTTSKFPNSAFDAFSFIGGSGNDTLKLRIDSAVTGGIRNQGEDADFRLTYAGSEGKDDLTLILDLPTGGKNAIDAWYANQSNNQRGNENITRENNGGLYSGTSIVISGGNGDDTIRKPGWGDVTIDAGAGNDTVYSDNSGTGRAVWAVSHDPAVTPVISSNTAVNGGIANLTSMLANNTPVFLYRGQLTVALSDSSSAAASLYQNGWEATVDIAYADPLSFTVTQTQINQAIKKAINEDAVLSKLLLAESGPGNSLSIVSKIDGRFVADDLRIEVSAPDSITGASAQELATPLAGFQRFSADPAATINQALAAQTASEAQINARSGMTSGADVFASLGANSSAQTDNAIDLGQGNNVLVLSTSALANETLIFRDSYPSNKKDTIVNFEDTQLSGLDHLDFREALLSRGINTNGSQGAYLATTVQIGGGITSANAVHVLTGLNFNNTDTFAGLSAERLLAALNQSNTGSANYAGISETTLDAQNTYIGAGNGANLERGLGATVVLIENDDNLGEYWAFKLTFNGTAANTHGDYRDAELIGQLDFGASINFATPGLIL
jgi:hypothetical protein